VHPYREQASALALHEHGPFESTGPHVCGSDERMGALTSSVSPMSGSTVRLPSSPTTDTSRFFYLPTDDTQYPHRASPECCGRLKTDEEGKSGYRAIVPARCLIRRNVGTSFLLLTCDGSHSR
jgi:hypothetical protein